MARPRFIQIPAPRTAGIDTCLMSTLRSDPDARSGFLEKVPREALTLFVSDTVLFELFSDGDRVRVFERAKAFRGLCEDLGAQLWRCPDYRELIELEAKAWFRSAPAHALDWAGITEASNEELWQMAGDLHESWAWMNTKKAELFNLDRGLHSYLTEGKHMRFDPADFRRHITSAVSPPPDEMMIEMAAGLSAADTPRFRLPTTLCAFAQHTRSRTSCSRLHLANAIAPALLTPDQEQVFGRWRTKSKNKRGEGVWHDSIIAARAAYLDLFLTSDDNLRRRCEFLWDRGLLAVRPISLEIFLGGPIVGED